MKRTAFNFIILLSFMTFFDAHSKQHMKNIVENTDYQLLLPTQDSTIYFIVHKTQIGIYDNVRHQELLLKDQVVRLEITPINAFKSYIDIFSENHLGKDNIKETYILSKGKNADVSITKADLEKRKSGYSDLNYYYENSIQFIDKDIVIHNLSVIEPSAKDDGIELFQKSGVYSLKENRFVIPPEHIKIEVYRSSKYEKEGRLFFKSLAIEEDESIRQMKYYVDVEEVSPYELLIKDFKYGLYSENFQLLIEPSNSEIHPMRFGGFNKGDGANELYDKSGRHIPTKNISVSDYEEVFITRQYITVKHIAYNFETDYRPDQEVYSFYDRTGQFIESKSMEISEFLQLPEKALGIVTSYKKDFEYITYNGIFNFEEKEFAIPDIYDEIKVVRENEIDYYFSCRKKDSLTYYNKDFKIFNLDSK